MSKLRLPPFLLKNLILELPVRRQATQCQVSHGSHHPLRATVRQDHLNLLWVEPRLGDTIGYGLEKARFAGSRHEPRHLSLPHAQADNRPPSSVLDGASWLWHLSSCFCQMVTSHITNCLSSVLFQVSFSSLQHA